MGLVHSGLTPSIPVAADGEIAARLAKAEADIAFLLARSGHAGSCSFAPGRWTGMSSNAIVSVAFGGPQSTMPSDREDYAACVRTYARLPRHRRTEAVKDALRKARAAYLARYPSHRFPAGRAAERAAYERLVAKRQDDLSRRRRSRA